MMKKRVDAAAARCRKQGMMYITGAKFVLAGRDVMRD